MQARIDEFIGQDPYLFARIHAEPDILELDAELEALTRNIQATFAEIVAGVPYLPESCRQPSRTSMTPRPSGT